MVSVRNLLWASGLSLDPLIQATGEELVARDAGLLTPTLDQRAGLQPIEDASLQRLERSLIDQEDSLRRTVSELRLKTADAVPCAALIDAAADGSSERERCGR